MSGNPIVSIIMPSLNVATYYRECIESVLAQTLKEIEILCVDAGSTDGTLEILKEEAEKDPRIRIIHSDMRSYGHQMNLGIDAAQGQYIGVVETDDIITPDMFESLYALSENGTVDLIKGNFWMYYDDDSEKTVPNKERKLVKNTQSSFTLREEPFILRGHPSIWSAIYRREFLIENNIRFMEIPGAGWVDNPFYYETFCAAKSIRWTPKPFYYYRQTNPNSSSNKLPDMTIAMRRMIDNLDVLDKYTYNDEDVLSMNYGRAFAYTHWTLNKEEYYPQQDKVRPSMRQMMQRLNGRIVRDESFYPGDQVLYTKYLSPLESICPVSGKVLFYNWVPFDNEDRIDTSVSDYCQNIMDEIIRKRPDIQVYFLSSGWMYDRSKGSCYIRHYESDLGGRCRAFEIVNSPVPSPHEFIRKNPAQAFEAPELKEQFAYFLKNNGPFNAVIFNSSDGLSLDIFDLKTDWPDTKFIYYMHSCAPVCFTGIGFIPHKQTPCGPDSCGGECAVCAQRGGPASPIREVCDRGTRASKKKKPLPEDEWLNALHLKSLEAGADESRFAELKEKAVSALNRNMDLILADSERVLKTAAGNGIAAEKTQLLYTGTEMADFQIGQPIARPDEYFKLAFFGGSYSDVRNGWGFFTESLSHIPPERAAKMDILIVSNNPIPAEVNEKLKGFHAVTNATGAYKRKELKPMLISADLGVIPMTGGDSVPKAAIEMKAIGAPVLSGSWSAAAELCGDEAFVFKGGDTQDFLEHIYHLMDHPEIREQYWQHSDRLPSIDEHWEALERILDIPGFGEITVSPEDFTAIMEENTSLYQLVDKLREDLNDIKISRSYKSGKTLMWAPSKARLFAASARKYGLKNAMNQVMKKIRSRLHK